MLKTIVLILCISIGGLTFAQQHSTPKYYDTDEIKKQNILEDDLQQYVDNDDFNYSEDLQEDSLWSKFKRWVRNILTKFWEAIFGVGSATGFLYFVLKILPYLLLALLIFLLVKFFLRMNSKTYNSNARYQGSISLSEEENIIKHEDISKLISTAIAQNNYRLAIRYYYLLSLKKLADRETIDWQPQKTNSDYINEIEQLELKTHFKHITHIYDYVWYGEFAVDAFKFETLKMPFISLQTEIENL